MNVLLISDDRQLAELFARTVLRNGDGLITAADMQAGAVRLSEANFDAVIASDRIVEEKLVLPFLEQARETGKESAGRWIWLASNPHQSRERQDGIKARLAEGWAVVPPGLSVKQVAERLGQLLYNDQVPARKPRNGLIQFVGSTPNIGTTVAAFGAAAAMSMLADLKIGFFCLNLKSAKLHHYLGETEPPLSLEGLRPELKAGFLSADRLLRQCRKPRGLPNLSVLYGNLHREQAEYFSLEEIDCLLRAANDAFDYCVVDTCAYWDNAATIGAMTHAGQRIIVTTPVLSHFREDIDRWCRVLSPVFGLQPADFDLLVTQQDREAFYRSKEIAADAGLPRIGEVRKDNRLDRSINEGRLLDCLRKETAIGSDLFRLARALLTLHGETAFKQPAANERLWSKMFGRRRRIGFAGR